MGYDYHHYTVVREAEARGLERRHAHARALKESPTDRIRRWPGIRHTIVAMMLRWRPVRVRPVAKGTGAAGLRIVDHHVTDYGCRLADGSMGRVVIIAGTDERWTAVCVPA